MENNLIIPEFILIHALKAGFDFIEKDFKEQITLNTPTNSYLYRILHDQRIERYDYYTQAQAILFKKKDDPRKLSIDLMFNMDFDKVPSVYISLPGEQHGQNNLGVEQNPESYFNVDENDNATSYTNRYTRRKNANYGIYIASDNSNEVSLLYYIIDCLMISMTPHLTLKGLYNITQGGQDLQIENDKIPKNFFMKSISLGLQYERSAPDLTNTPMFTDIIFEGRPVNSIE